jgi:hypothetical protein
LTNNKGSDKTGKHGYIWEQNISIQLQEMMYDGTEWMVEDKKQGQAFVNMITFFTS